MSEYDFKKVEEKWEKINEDKNLYKTIDDFSKKKEYILDMFPYPSGEGLHAGHTRIYSCSDFYTRMRRMQGVNVLHPTGWDAFGLPAEQFAIKNKLHPKISTDKNIDNFRRQMKMLDLSYDFDREINTTDPSYYKWTQWIFLQMYKKGLAYESYEPINWCPSCQTGLANEDLEAGKCERCGSQVEQKPMRQWVLRITDYADRLLDDLNTLPLWPEWTKDLQRNWIGKSTGSSFSFALSKTNIDGTEIVTKGIPEHVEIFTTRADTLFGATYLAISAELAKGWIKNGWEASEDIKSFIEEILEEQKKDNFNISKEKKGVFTGVLAINPVNNKKIPIWIANYVLGGVGTGAIMAVPAHDERDFDFAKKFGLPVHEVVAKHYVIVGKDEERDGKETLIRSVVDSIIRDDEWNFYLIKEKEGNHVHFAGGGVDVGEDDLKALAREIKEETGFTDFRIERKIMPQVSCWGYRHTKDKNQRSIGPAYEVILNSDTRVHSEVEDGRHDLLKFKKEDVLKNITWEHHRFLFEQYLTDKKTFEGEGILINSDKFNGLTSEEARKKITEEFGGKFITRYKLKDWVFSRQRYWGEPIPIIHDEHGTAYPLHESVLPVVLPNVENYAPSGTGESPLVNIDDWMDVMGYINEDGSVTTVDDAGQVEEGKEVKKFRRESNTMPQWAGSSWYYLRFTDPHNDKELISKELEKYWNSVDVYVGGAEHATRHMIYARFYHKFLQDIGIVFNKEPFTRFESVGLVLGDGGVKMSKRLGNIVNPDDVINKWGSDTTRVYVAFMGSFYDATIWDDKSIIGCERFLEKVWKVKDYVVDEEVKELNKIIHQTTKKVTEDISTFKFNTAISQLMICINTVEENKKIDKGSWEMFIKLLAPFATKMSEELWAELGNDTSIHLSSWPEYSEDLIVETSVTIALQINGKLRETFEMQYGASDEEITEIIKTLDNYKKYVGEATPKRIIIIPNKIVNIVI